MNLTQHINKQNPIARKTVMLLAAITLGIAVGTNALAAGRGGGGHGAGGHMGAGFGAGHIGGGFGGSRMGGSHLGGSHLGGLGGAHVGSPGGARLHGPRLGGGFHNGHHRFGGSLRGGTYGYFPNYDYGYAGDYADGSACFQYRHVHTTAGWRWRRVRVCD